MSWRWWSRASHFCGGPATRHTPKKVEVGRASFTGEAGARQPLKQAAERSKRYPSLLLYLLLMYPEALNSQASQKVQHRRSPVSCIRPAIHPVTPKSKMRRPTCSLRTDDDDRACSLSALSIPSVAAANSTTVSAASSPQPCRSSFGCRRGIFLTSVAAVAVVLGSSSPVFAFGPQHKNLAPAASRSNSGSHLPSSVSYAADQPDNSTASSASALRASSFAPPAPGRSSDRQEDEATTAARTLLASKTEEVATLRAAQADQLQRISELTSNLSNVHGDTDKLYTDLVKSQAELVKGLEQVTNLISEVSAATGTLTDVEVQRMEAMTALEDLVGVVEDVATEEMLEIEEEEAAVVNSASAVAVQVIKCSSCCTHSGILTNQCRKLSSLF